MVLRRMKFALISGIAAIVLSGPAQAETVSQALASAYATNPELTSALLDAQSAAEGIVRAKAGGRPNISAGASVNDSFGLTNGVHTPTSSLSLTLNQTVFDGGATAAQVEAARAAADAKADVYLATVQSILLSTAQAYANVARDTQIAQLRRDNIAFFEAQFQASKDRLDVGEGTSTEVSQASARLAQAGADYQSALANLAISQATYVRYVGHAPSGLQLSFPYENLLPHSLEAALTLTESHPSIRSALSGLRAARAQSDIAQATAGPTVSFSANAGATNNYSTGTTSLTGSVGLSLRVPLYSGGGNGAAQRQANLGEIKSEIDANTTRDLLRAQVTSAWSNLKSAAAVIAAVTAAENASLQVLDNVQEELNVGQKTTLDVLNARADLTSVQVSKISAQANRVTAAFSLLSAVGRLFPENLGLGVQTRTPEAYRQKVEDIWQDLRAVPDQ